MPHNSNNEGMDLSVQNIPILARQRADLELWLDDAGAVTWFQFGAAIERVTQLCLETGVGPGDIVVTSGESTLESLIWLFGVAAVGAVVAPLRRERLGEIQGWKNFVEIRWHASEGRVEQLRQGRSSPIAASLLGELRRRNHPGLILATGGSTGVPKIVLHDLASLLGTVPVKNGPSRRTLPLMRFDHIGGLDMAWRALASRQILVAPPRDAAPVAIANTIERHRVEVLPATPSFLNLLLLSGGHRNHDLSSLRIVPYGAETMPAGLLARLRVAFPQVEFTQRFGTSETGALPVKDGGAGLILRNEHFDYAWKIVDDELWIRSPARALGYLSGEISAFDADGWFRTGDLAEEMSEGVIRVLGRRQAMINVGGEKVMPDEVEGVLLSHPLVADCRVGSEPSALLGQRVVAEIVWAGAEADALAVKRILHAFALKLLPRHKLPAVVRLVAAVDMTRNLKKFRLLSA